MEPGSPEINSKPNQSSSEYLTKIETENRKRDFDKKILEFFDKNRAFNDEIGLLRAEYLDLKSRVQSQEDWASGMQNLFKKSFDLKKRREREFKDLQEVFDAADRAGISLDDIE